MWHTRGASSARERGDAPTDRDTSHPSSGGTAPTGCSRSRTPAHAADKARTPLSNVGGAHTQRHLAPRVVNKTTPAVPAALATVLSCRSCSGLDEVGLIHRFVLVKLDCGGRAGARVRSHRSSEARPQLPVEDLGGCRVLWRVVASGRRSRSIGAPPRAGLGLWRSRPSGRSVRRRRDGGRRAIEVREARLGEVSTLVNLGQLLGRLSCQPPHEGRLICFTRVSANSRAPSPAPSTMPVATGKRNPRRAASARRTLP